jgi:hypothetical protein
MSNGTKVALTQGTTVYFYTETGMIIITCRQGMTLAVGS